MTEKQSAFRSIFRKVIKSSMGIALIVGVGWYPMQSVLEPSSVDASVNAQLTVIRAPLSGRLEGDMQDFAVGVNLTRGSHLLKIVNDRTDRNSLINSEAEVLKLIRDRDVISEQLSFYENLRKQMSDRVDDFIISRRDILKQRSSAANARSNAARADLVAAHQALERAEALNKKGAGNLAAVEESKRRTESAQSSLQAASSDLLTIQAEFIALNEGKFIGDGYNDVPRTLQRVDEIDLNILSLKTEMSKIGQHIESTRQLIDTHRDVYRGNSIADVKVPRTGQVWDVLALPGESVTQGQEVLRLLDCSALLVTATVDEITFNKLRQNERVYFRPKSSRKGYAGKIVQLSGRSPAQSNLALPPVASDTNKDFFVTAALDRLHTNECLVARTGRLIFAEKK